MNRPSPPAPLPSDGPSPAEAALAREGGRGWRSRGRGTAPGEGPRPGGIGAAGGFTLAEVLAAMVFLAIVIPVAVEGLRIASRAGVVSQRKAIAARVADRMLNEWLVTGAAITASPRGTVEEDGQIFDWSLRSEAWTDASMRLVTVEVFYEVQGQEFDLRLCTLAGSN